MAIQFLIGRAGSGKTRTCLDEIHRHLRESPSGPPLIFLVPEQATFQMERALLSTGPIRATHRAHVVSFRRLAYRLLQDGAGPVPRRLGSLGKLMALMALLQKRRNELKLFGASGRLPGLARQLAETITELRAWRVRPWDLEQAARRSDALGDKLHDLALLYADYEDYLDGRFSDPDRVLDEAADLIPASPWLQGALVWVDGFARFNGQEIYALRALWRTAARTTIALCLEAEDLGAPPDEADLFAPTRSTYDRLIRLAREDGVPIRPPRVLRASPPPRFTSSPALAHLEAHLFRPGARPFIGPPPGELQKQLCLVAAADPATEVAAAAREILRLCREHGWRFRDISVILRDLQGYEPLIASIFSEHGIPYFLDRRRSLTHHPLIELVRSALEVYVGNWSPEAVFRCLRTDLIPGERDEVDRLEGYVSARGIEGDAWLDSAPWPDPTLDGIRRRLTRPLANLTRHLAEAERVSQVVEALGDFLEEIGAAQTLARWEEEARAAGRLEEAREHGGAWDGIVQLLEEMDEALGPLPLSPAACLPILEAGLEGLTVGIIPPTLDQVLVGSAERSRQPDIRAAFILGADERHFPPPAPEDVILSDRERETLADQFELGPTSRTRVLHEQYLTYIALTRSSHLVWLSYPVADQEGRAFAPGPFVQRLRRLFPELPLRVEEREAPDEESALSRIWSEDQLVAATAHRLRRHRDGETADPLWWDVYHWLVADPDRRRRALPVFAALNYRNEPTLAPALARALFGRPLVASPSRLESFAACPFQHFARYGLRLEEPERPLLDRAEVGSFLHAALRRFVERLREENRPWASLSDEEAVQWADEAAAELLPSLEAKIPATPRHRFALRLLREDLRRAAARLTEHARRSDFQPLAVELPFGDGAGGNGLPPLTIPLADGSAVLVRGRIDRVDGAVDEAGRPWVRIIDYKSRAINFSPTRFYHGLTLQLPLYMAAILRHGAPLLAPLEGTGRSGEGAGRGAAAGRGSGPKAPEAAGFLYFPIRDSLTSIDRPAGGGEGPAGEDSGMKMRGLVRDDPAVLQLMDRNLSPGGGMSPLIPAGLTAQGTVHGQSSSATAAQWRDLIRWALGKTGQLAGQMLQGRIAIAPYRLRRESPCSFCPYRSVCRFDPSTGGNRYNRLESWPPREAWQRIGDALAAEGGIPPAEAFSAEGPDRQ